MNKSQTDSAQFGFSVSWFGFKGAVVRRYLDAVKINSRLI